MQPGGHYDPDTCLAYRVLDDPIPWLGLPSAKFLSAFLYGAETRRFMVDPAFPIARVCGVLGDPELSRQFIDATGHPKLSIMYSTALEITHFSLADGFAKLRGEVIRWHEEHGWSNVLDETIYPEFDLAEHFWNGFSKRPAMYTGGFDGWSLYCYLNGMRCGGDWLGLAEVSKLNKVFDAIQSKSESSYGTGFAAFRLHNAKSLLAWAGLSATE